MAVPHCRKLRIRELSTILSNYPNGKAIKAIFFHRLILLNSSLAKTAPHPEWINIFPDESDPRLGKSQFTILHAHPLFPHPLNDGTCLPGIKECPQMERVEGRGGEGNQGVSADGTEGGDAANENSKRQEYHFGICIKVTKPSPNPRHHFRAPFYFSFSLGSFTTSLAYSRDVPRDGEIVIGRVLYPLSAGDGRKRLQNGKEQKGE
ncbi:hypothetical protein CEXT_159871 [Caerostris extrusa]|uniref:Uncharacterized protein n=1 Tax=Caerostris extrusa TaxID=172846 RepID=A0AAV4TTX9_CAEEX|nr:hypothetical protein CEXT_159871 [Caerostris extrusa]